MTTRAEVLADSIGAFPGSLSRLVTLRLTFPRFILAELNTHRMLSRNSASSRAIPTEIFIERVRTDPFIPTTFNQRVKGMGVGEEMTEGDAATSRTAWLRAAEAAADEAETLMRIGLDKSRANRLLEPFLWHTAIVSSTEWDNFFALRDHEAAQPEFRVLAQAMRRAIKESKPRKLTRGGWHTPFVTEQQEMNWTVAFQKRVSAGLCARVSYDRSDAETPEASADRADKLQVAGHLSPFEHVARPFTTEEWELVADAQEKARIKAIMAGEVLGEHLLRQMEFCGNYRGWVQMRKGFPHEYDFGQVVKGEQE